jgi:hypothetical protein
VCQQQLQEVNVTVARVPTEASIGAKAWESSRQEMVDAHAAAVAQLRSSLEAQLTVCQQQLQGANVTVARVASMSQLGPLPSGPNAHSFLGRGRSRTCRPGSGPARWRPWGQHGPAAHTQHIHTRYREPSQHKQTNGRT